MGFFSRFFGNRPKPVLSSGTPPNIIVADFGEVIEKSGTVGLGCVADVTELPYQKEEIKRAILIMLAVTTDSQLRQHLKNAYVLLAGWQVGVGSSHQGLNVTEIMNSTKPIDDRAEEFLAQNNEWKKWESIVEAEQKALTKELIDLFGS